jgi:NifU-like protein involved in Fe-S cluster formation
MTNHNKGDIHINGEESGWVYSDIVRDHFMNPRNVLWDEKTFEADGKGIVGNPACGDMMGAWIQVDEKTQRIKACKWRTYGCASAIAATSMMSVMVTENNGMTLDEAKHLKPQAIAERLGGLPDRKIHCSVLGHHALRAAIEDYETNHAK